MSSKSLLAKVHSAGSPGSGEDAQPILWRRVGEPEVPVRPNASELATGPPPPPPSESPLEAALAEAQMRSQMAQAQALKDGVAQGIVEGEKRARAELAPLIERFARTIADLSSTRDAFRREAEEDVVRLSLGVARRILHREISIDPDALSGVIRVALGKFESRELHRVLVSEQDHAAVSAALQTLRLPRRVEVIADSSLERGAALFETVKGTLDASVDTQLDEIERGFLDVLGKDGRRG